MRWGGASAARLRGRGDRGGLGGWGRGRELLRCRAILERHVEVELHLRAGVLGRVALLLRPAVSAPEVTGLPVSAPLKASTSALS